MTKYLLIIGFLNTVGEIHRLPEVPAYVQDSQERCLETSKEPILLLSYQELVNKINPDYKVRVWCEEIKSK